MIVKPSADTLASTVSQAAAKGPPPVHLWNPPYCGEMDLRIRRDGAWVHEGMPIGREAMVRLFASILKKEDGRHYLVTPVEKLGIVVEDAPFIAQDMDAGPEGLTFTTNVGDRVTAGPDDPIRVERDPVTDEPAPYVHVRRGLEARIDRKTFYRMVDLAEERDGWLGVTSRGAFFRIAPQVAEG